MHFASGETDTKDRPRPGQPRRSHSDEQIRAAQAIVDEEKRISVRELADRMDISVGSAHKLLKDDLKLQKKALKFVPRVLTDDQKEMRHSLCEENLWLVRADPGLLDRIITGDESWFSVFEPELKSKSAMWLQKGEACPKKALRSRQVKHTMVELFFDSSGLVNIEFLPPKMTVTSSVYIGVLSRLRESIRCRRPHLWVANLYRLLHDNAPGHKVNHTVARMMETQMFEISHPPYSPD